MTPPGKTKKMSTENITIRSTEIAGTRRTDRTGREVISYQTDLAEGWTVRLDCAAGEWSGYIWRAGTSYEGEWTLRGASPEALIADAEEMLRPRDLGTLSPLDVGFDVRVTGTAVELPYRALRVTIHVPTRKSAAGRKVTGTSESVAADLRGSGYRVAIREEAKA